MNFFKVAYAQEGVFIHLCSPETADDVMLGGTLKIFEKVIEIVVLF